MQVVGYSNVDYIWDIDTQCLTTCYSSLLASGAISWKSKKQSIVALSDIEVEYTIATHATKEIIWL